MATRVDRSEEHTSELQSPCNLVCRLLLEKKKKKTQQTPTSKLSQTPQQGCFSTCYPVQPLHRCVVSPVHLSLSCFSSSFFFFFFNDPAPPEFSPFPPPAPLPI